MQTYRTIAHTDAYGNSYNARVFVTFEKDGETFAVISRRTGNYDTGTPFQVVQLGEDGVNYWDAALLEACLAGDNVAIAELTTWNLTAEGHDFWADQYYNGLTDVGRNVLLAVKGQFE